MKQLIPSAINVAAFFREYAPRVKAYKMKMTDKSPWTTSDQAEIRAGLKKFLKDLIIITKK